ncbi:MAG: hypothetical protein Q9159_003573 [Coniocarpon cinnabarinum]
MDLGLFYLGSKSLLNALYVANAKFTQIKEHASSSADIFSYGTLLGSTIFQSFIAGPVAFKVLPRPSFATLQTGIFPVYFAMQTALPAMMALTFPDVASSAVTGARVSAGPMGLLDDRVRLSALTPLGVAFATALVNLVWLGPVTTQVMKERKHQETRDGKKSYDAGPHSPEMQRLNKKFGQLHGVSSLANVVGLAALIFYGGTIADMIR